ncbi:MAG: hypothetical protein QME12_03450 [Nanoarchaeota archaeon]|nr:hypothetical protein [Nanoarchaeota archaeon]
MNKKGAEWIGYILATGLFVAISVMAILWAKGHTEEATSSTIKYMEGKEECKMVFIDAKENGIIDEQCVSITIKNKGTVKIAKFVVRLNSTAGMAEADDTGPLMPNPDQTIDLSIPETIKNVELLPIVEISKGQLASCTTKRLVVQCA